MIGIVEGAVGGLLVLAVNTYGHQAYKAGIDCISSVKSKLDDYMHRRGVLRSVAGWNSDTQAVVWLHWFFTKGIIRNSCRAHVRAQQLPASRCLVY